MNEVLTKMTKEDINVLIIAIYNALYTLLYALLIFIILEIFAKFYIIHEVKNIEVFEVGFLYLFPFLVLTIFLSKSIFIFLDFICKTKIIYKCNCIFIEDAGEITTYSIRLENGKEINLEGFNKEYLNIFTPEHVKYELHIARFSNTILNCKQIPTDSRSL